MNKGVSSFFLTSVLPCPYINGLKEQRIVADLGHKNPIQLHEALSEIGFRRSHGIAYKPACPGCKQCIPVRVNSSRFILSRSQKRVLSKNIDIQIKVLRPKARKEQFELFSEYQSSRHRDGEMSKMGFTEFQSMIEETPINTFLVEFRLSDEVLIGVLLIDEIANSLSAVYSFFDSNKKKRSLGIFMILWLIKYAKKQSKDYVYLGFWVEGAKKMDYKISFKPIEKYTNEGWVEV